MKFQFGIAFVLHQEGGFVEDLGDGAGPTNRGLTARSYPDLDIKNLTLEDTLTIYRRDFFDALRLGELPLPLAVAMLDTATNHGQVTAVRLLQAVLGVAQDGVIGPVTIAAAHAQQRTVVDALLIARALRYSESKNFSKFSRVWMRRLFACARYCGGLPS